MRRVEVVFLLPVSNFNKATETKMTGSYLNTSANYSDAIGKYTEAILTAKPLALLLANRAHCLFKLWRYAAAIRGSDAALTKSPESAEAL